MEKELNSINCAKLSMSIDRSDVKKLLDVADPPDQVKLKVLFNAVVKCTKDYNAEPSSAKLNDWQKAEAALKEFTTQLQEEYYPGEKTLLNIQDVLSYLQDAGWQVSQSGLYKHRKEGKVASQPDGSFLLKDVEKYAKAWLKQKATGKRVQDRLDELQRSKLEKELEKLEIDNTRGRLKRDVELGKYILRDEMYLEMASRSGVLDAGLDHWIRTTCAEWVRLVEGNLQKVGALIDSMIRGKDNLINQFASIRDFQVIIDGIDDDDDEEEEIE